MTLVIALSPQVSPAEPPGISLAAGILTVAGTAIDLAAIPPFGTLARDATASSWIVGDIVRDGTGTVTVPLLFPIAPVAPEALCFPAPLVVTADGPVALPA
jgi:hypothetical protein